MNEDENDDLAVYVDALRHRLKDAQRERDEALQARDVALARVVELEKRLFEVMDALDEFAVFPSEEARKASSASMTIDTCAPLHECVEAMHKALRGRRELERMLDASNHSVKRWMKACYKIMAEKDDFQRAWHRERRLREREQTREAFLDERA